jgi:hypothetical protein
MTEKRDLAVVYIFGFSVPKRTVPGIKSLVQKISW